MTIFELRIALPLSPPAIFADSTYACPKLQWLTGPFWTWFQKTRSDLGLNNWTRNNDCDNWARAYAQSASDCHALTSDVTEGLAVGEFYYVQATGGGHAIVCAFTDMGRVFIEPQTGKQLQLTPKEIETCSFVRF